MAEVEDDVERSVLIVHYQSFVSETFVDVIIVSEVAKAVLHLELVVIGVVTYVVDVLIAERFVLFYLAHFQLVLLVLIGVIDSQIDVHAGVLDYPILQEVLTS